MRAWLTVCLIGLVNGAAAQERACTPTSGVQPLTGPGHLVRRDQPLFGLTPPRADYVRKAAARYPDDCARGHGFALTPVAVRSAYNSEFALDRNNGSLWAGRGAALAYTAGFSLKWSVLELMVAPEVTWSENRSFDLTPFDVPGLSPFSYAGHPGLIDWPQRFGSTEFESWQPGQSVARISVRGVEAGVSTENIWTGPAIYYPILMSNTAAGFPHAYFALPRVRLPFGTAGLSMWWGKLRESEFFDDVEENDRRVLHGANLEFEPSFARGLWLGFSRLYAMNAQDRSTPELLLRPFGKSDDALRRIADNSLYALYGRYVMPASRAEFYIEWAHEAPFNSLLDFLSEPDQSQGYTFGFQKLLGNPNSYLRLYAEATHLETAAPARGGRGLLTFYTHGSVRQGHTHEGQLLGSWLGPGSDAQRVGLDLVQPSRTLGVYVERDRFDDDAYYDQWGVYYSFLGHDAQLMAGVRGALASGPLSMEFDLAVAQRYNRAFHSFTGSQPPILTVDRNLSADLVLRWTPNIFARPGGRP